MDGYIERLEACGIQRADAEEICRDTLRNFPTYELEIVVKEKELAYVRDNYVGTVQSKPSRPNCWGLLG